MDADMAKLNGVYINACIDIMAPNPAERLQIFGPYIPLPNDSALNNILDFNPKFTLLSKGPDQKAPGPLRAPAAPGAHPVPVLTNGYFVTYGNMILNELAVPEEELPKVLGEDYDGFKAYRKQWVKDKRGKNSDLENCVADYVVEEYPGRSPNKVKNAARHDANNPVILAGNMYQSVRDDDSRNWDDYYGWTLQSAANMVANGQGKTIKFNSKTSKSDTSTTWAHGEMSGGFDFFSASASTDYKDVKTKISNSEIDFSMTVGKYTTISAEAMGGWYYKPAMTAATKSKAAFDDESNWTKHFNRENNQYGDLVWKVSELIVGSDITCTMNLKNSDLVKDEATFQAQAKGGFWPFFTAQGSGGNTDTKVNDSNDGIEITFCTTPGTFMALGIKVSSPFDS